MPLFKNTKEIAKKYGVMNRNLKLKTEMDLGAYNFLRYHNILSKIDEFAFAVHSLAPSAIRPFYASLRTLFHNIDKLLRDPISKEYKNLFDEILEDIESWEGDRSKRDKFPKDVALKLSEMHIKMLHSMQIMGLGDKTYTPYATESRVYSEIVGE